MWVPPMSHLLRGVTASLLSFAAALCLAANVRVDGTTVVVNEVPVLAFRANDPVQRARNLVAELRALSGNEPVSLAKDRGKYVLKVGSVLISDFDQEAADRSVSPQQLAHQWAARLSYAFALPALRVAVSNLNVGVGAKQSVSVVGSLVPQAELKVDDAAIVLAKLNGADIEIAGLKPGHARISITSGRAIQQIDVDVRPWAASLPQTLNVSVSGAPAIASTIAGAIWSALQTRLVTADGANVFFSLPRIDDEGPGVTRAFRVNARVSAPNTLESSGVVSVVVHNLGLPQEKDEALWYSNDPESVVRPGALFSSTLKLDSPTRLLYHHINASQQALYLRVQAINDSDSVAQILIIPGDSKPDRNPVRAGLRAADQYVRAWMWGSGEVISIPAHSTLPISLRRLLPGETMSGLCSLRLISGPKELQVRTDAWPLFPIDRKWEAATSSSTPWRVVGTNAMNDYDRAPYEPSQRIFPNPYRDDAVRYSVGGRFGVCRIGQRPIPSQDDSQRLEGNFGVVYRIHAEISNPTADATDVDVVFEASAGYSGALFIVNGDYRVTPLLQPKDEAVIGKFHLAPGALQKFVITTMPVSGGSYPVTITIRPAQSAANAATR
jgi:hypothetical protein